MRSVKPRPAIRCLSLAASSPLIGPLMRKPQKNSKIFFLKSSLPELHAQQSRSLSAKRLLNIRLLELDMGQPQRGGYDLRRVRGGILLQDWDTGSVDVRACKVVTQRKPTEQEYQALDFAWRVCRHVKSNTIVFASPIRFSAWVPVR